MRTKNFLIFLCSIVATSLLLILFRQQKPSTIQNIVTTTHQQIRNIQDTFKQDEVKTLVADEKYLALLGFTKEPHLFQQDLQNSTSPVFVTYIMEGQESQAIGLINNVAKLLPNATVLIYNLGLGNYGIRTLSSHCNNTRCQVVTFNFINFPSHVEDESLHAYRPLIIQDALYRFGMIFFLECDHRFEKHITSDFLFTLFDYVSKSSGIMAWPITIKNAVSSRTHKKMFDYFRTEADNFLFVQMISADALLIVNTQDIHENVMLPWVECALTQDCIHPIGAQSGGCRFNKKPQYRYSGCHSYDASALNIILGINFKFDSTQYTYQDSRKLFQTLPLERAILELQGLEQNATTEGKMQLFESQTP